MQIGEAVNTTWNIKLLKDKRNAVVFSGFAETVINVDYQIVMVEVNLKELFLEFALKFQFWQSKTD